MKDKLRKALSTVSRIKKFLEKVLGDEKLRNEFKDQSPVLEELAEDLEVNEFVPIILEGKMDTIRFDSPDLFREVSEAVLSFEENWNESAALLSLCGYTLAGGKITEAEDPETEGEEDNTPLTVGELYALGEEDEDYAVEAKLSSAQRKKLPTTAFCGPDRSFPVHDKAHVTAALRLLGRYKGPGDKGKIRACIMRKARAMGMTPKTKESEETLFIFQPLKIAGLETFSLITLDSSEVAKATLENLNKIGEALHLEDSVIQEVKDLIGEYIPLLEYQETDNTSVAPLFALQSENKKAVVLPAEHILEVLMEREMGSEHSTLAALVGVCRRLKLTKEQVKSAQEAYSPLAGSVLKSFLANLPESEEAKKEGDKDGTAESEVITPIVTEEPSEEAEESQGKIKSIMDRYTIKAPLKDTRRKS